MLSQACARCQQRPATAASSRPSGLLRARLVVRCSGNGTSSGAFVAGQRVKVATSIKVFNAPKHPEGLDLMGMEGTVVKDVTQYKGKVLSANYPMEVEFVLTPGSEGVRPSKFKVHLVRAGASRAARTWPCCRLPV